MNNHYLVLLRKHSLNADRTLPRGGNADTMSASTMIIELISNVHTILLKYCYALTRDKVTNIYDKMCQYLKYMSQSNLTFKEKMRHDKSQHSPLSEFPSYVFTRSVRSRKKTRERMISFINYSSLNPGLHRLAHGSRVDKSAMCRQ